MDTLASPSVRAASCLVCGGAHAEQRFVQRGYPALRCTDCGLEFVAPIPSPSELADYYNRGYAVPLERYAAAGHRNIARIDHKGTISAAQSPGTEDAASSASSPGAKPSAEQPSGLLQAWLQLLTRAQPITDALARGTRPLIEPLERRGWGDELLVYARRIA